MDRAKVCQRVIGFVVMVLLAGASAAHAVTVPQGQWTGSFSLSRTVDDTRSSGADLTETRTATENWTVTLVEPLSRDANDGNGYHTYRATISGAMSFTRQERGAFGYASPVYRGSYSGSGPVQIYITYAGDYWNIGFDQIPGGGLPGSQSEPADPNVDGQAADPRKNHTLPWQPGFFGKLRIGTPTTAFDVDSCLSCGGDDDTAGIAWGTDDADDAYTLDVTKLVHQPPPPQPACSNGKDDDGDGQVDHPADPGCASPADGDEQDNRPPVARPDRWQVRGGDYVYDTILGNDADPDGDAITPFVTRISFKAAEWSGMERDGIFSYVAGPGTRVRQQKVITYHLVDARGARSPSTTAVIDVIPAGAAGASPIVAGPPKGKARPRAAGPRWYAHARSMRSCFGSGLKLRCFTLLSFPATAATNLATSFVGRPSYAQAYRVCGRSFVKRANVAACAAALAASTLAKAGDKQIFRTASPDYCVVSETHVRRTLAHPLAGEFTKPDFHPVHSLVGQGKWATWSRGLTGSYRVPLACGVDGRAYAYYPSPLVPR